mmetsp:Transcript_24482/g.59559  ORF Transcript_24482/g.59559 Transcript_24482/m.59559 type:complete len:144 (-) Transcript_24482:12-443(-)
MHYEQRVRAAAPPPTTSWPAPALIVISSAIARSLLSWSPGITPYNASKMGLLGAALNMWPELCAHGIRVSTISPGLIDNDLGNKPNVALPYQRDRIISTRDVADCVEFVIDSTPTACPTHITLLTQLPVELDARRIAANVAKL